MDLLIDGDIIAYRSAAASDGRQYIIRYRNETGKIITILEKYKKDATAIANSLTKEGKKDVALSLEYEPEPLANAVFLMKKSLEGVVRECTDHYNEPCDVKIYLSRGGSFREKEFPSYKNNRANLRRPAHLEALKDLMEKDYGAECERGKYEADDMMAFNQKGEDTVICSIDKDLLQVPGNHYNFVKKEFSIVDERQGNRSLYLQMLTGDATDGIPGLKGVGPKTAEKLLGSVNSPYLMYLVVLKAYYDKLPREDGETEQEFQIRVAQTVRAHARLLYLLRTEDDSWEPPEPEGV